MYLSLLHPTRNVQHKIISADFGCLGAAPPIVTIDLGRRDTIAPVFRSALASLDSSQNHSLYTVGEDRWWGKKFIKLVKILFLMQ